MVAKLFLGISLIGAEWVLYLLLLLSILSVALMFERVGFYRQASKGLKEFRERVRKAAGSGKWDEVLDVANTACATSLAACPI
jgi:biopolymer transport protein ExbB